MSTRGLRGTGTAALLASVVGFASCRQATQIVLDVRTNAFCAGQGTPALVDVLIAGGLKVSQSNVSGTVTKDCVDGVVGDLVLLPNGGSDPSVEVVVVAGLAVDASSVAPAAQMSAEDCAQLLKTPDGIEGAPCIVARRRLTFVEHASLALTVDLDTACIGKECGEDLTCSNGRCVDPVTTCQGEQCALDGGCEPQKCQTDCGGVCISGSCECAEQCNPADCAQTSCPGGAPAECIDNGCGCPGPCDQATCTLPCDPGQISQCTQNGCVCVCDSLACQGTNPDDVCACVSNNCMCVVTATTSSSSVSTTSTTVSSVTTTTLAVTTIATTSTMGGAGGEGGGVVVAPQGSGIGGSGMGGNGGSGGSGGGIMAPAGPGVGGFGMGGGFVMMCPPANNFANCQLSCPTYCGACTATCASGMCTCN